MNQIFSCWKYKNYYFVSCGLSSMFTLGRCLGEEEGFEPRYRNDFVKKERYPSENPSSPKLKLGLWHLSLEKFGGSTGNLH